MPISCKTRLAALLIPLVLLLGMAAVANHAADFSAMLQARIVFCLQTLIPSLYGCTAIAILLRESGAGTKLGWLFRHFAAWFHMSPAVFGIFLISQLAGYPVGTLLLRQSADSGTLSHANAALLSGICFGGGSAFFVGFTGAQLFGSTTAGWCIMAACIAANLCLARFTLPPLHHTEQQTTSPPCRLSATMLTMAASDAVRTLSQICGMVLLSGILQCGTELLPVWDILADTSVPIVPCKAILAALLDITQLQAIFHAGLPYWILLPLATALLSFGGICVHLQCLSIGGDALHPLSLLRTRLCSSLLAAAFSALMLPLLPLSDDVTAVFQPATAISSSDSILPSLLILCTAFPILLLPPAPSSEK